MAKRPKESHSRTLFKAISWRIVAFLITAIVTWIVTGQLTLAASIGLIDTAIKIGAYYFHERLWMRIPYGQPDYEI